MDTARYQPVLDLIEPREILKAAESSATHVRQSGVVNAYLILIGWRTAEMPYVCQDR